MVSAVLFIMEPEVLAAVPGLRVRLFLYLVLQMSACHVADVVGEMDESLLCPICTVLSKPHSCLMRDTLGHLDLADPSESVPPTGRRLRRSG